MKWATILYKGIHIFIKWMANTVTHVKSLINTYSMDKQAVLQGSHVAIQVNSTLVMLKQLHKMNIPKAI